MKINLHIKKGFTPSLEKAVASGGERLSISRFFRGVSFFHLPHYPRRRKTPTAFFSAGFTLIELLVVISIIAILASIVLASLNSARDNGRAVAIKSNLKDMGPQMELAYSNASGYSTINTGGTANRPNTVCIGPVADIATAIINSGAKVRCLSVNYSGWGDLAQRWGASGLIYTTVAPVKAWSASNSGAVTWDAQGVNSAGSFVGSDVTMDWNTAITACALSGGRLPTIEELKTLADAECEAMGSADCTVDSVRNPPGFVATFYWSGTSVPSDGPYAYLVYFNLWQHGRQC